MVKRLPKNFKYGRLFGSILGNNSAKFLKMRCNVFGLVVLKDFILSYKQLWAVTGVIKKWFKKRAFFKLNYGLVYPVTKKPVSARMGKGKGPRVEFVTFVKKGSIFLELGNVEVLQCLKALKECEDRLPVPCKIVLLKC